LKELKSVLWKEQSRFV